jgi:putative endonuclease
MALMNKKLQLGRWGEQLAAQYLTGLGFIVIDQNVRTPYGEIDLVTQYIDQDETCWVIFVEVKTRTSVSFGLPEQSITASKREHLLNSASYYMQQHPEMGENWRVDAIAIQKGVKKNPPNILVFENILEI